MTKNVLAREQVSEATQNYLLLNRITSAISAMVLRSAAEQGQITRVRVHDALVKYCESPHDWRELSSSAPKSTDTVIDADSYRFLLERMHDVHVMVLGIVANETHFDPPTTVQDALDTVFMKFPKYLLRPCLTQDVARSK